MSFYKYYSPESVDFILIRHSISLRLSQLDTLNDPFEMKLEFQMNEYQEELAKQIIKEENKNISSDELEIKLAQERRSHQKNSNNVFSKSYGVLSLSKNDNSNTMWAYCAKNHTGFMIDISPENHIDFIDSIKKVDYCDKRPIYSEIGQKSLYRKSTQWVGEREHRVIKNIKSLPYKRTDPSGYPIYCIELSTEYINRIVLGCRADAVLERKVKEWAKLHTFPIKVEKATLCESSYELKYNPI